MELHKVFLYAPEHDQEKYTYYMQFIIFVQKLILGNKTL